jgi:hypothetical protein
MPLVEERRVWLAMADRRRIVAAVNVRHQTECFHQIAGSFVLLVRSQIDAKPAAAERCQILQQLRIQASVLLKPIRHHLFHCEPWSDPREDGCQPLTEIGSTGHDFVPISLEEDGLENFKTHSKIDFEASGPVAPVRRPIDYSRSFSSTHLSASISRVIIGVRPHADGPEALACGHAASL